MRETGQRCSVGTFGAKPSFCARDGNCGIAVSIARWILYYVPILSP